MSLWFNHALHVSLDILGISQGAFENMGGLGCKKKFSIQDIQNFSLKNWSIIPTIKI
jgi:hypothetical protein